KISISPSARRRHSLNTSTPPTARDAPKGVRSPARTFELISVAHPAPTSAPRPDDGCDKLPPRSLEDGEVEPGKDERSGGELGSGLEDEADPGREFVLPRPADDDPALRRLFGERPRLLAHDDGEIAGERLERGQPEPFIPGGEEEEVGRGVHGRQVVVRDPSERSDVAQRTRMLAAHDQEEDVRHQPRDPRQDVEPLRVVRTADEQPDWRAG